MKKQEELERKAISASRPYCNKVHDKFIRKRFVSYADLMRIGINCFKKGFKTKSQEAEK